MAVKLKKVVSELLTEEAKHVGRWSRDHTSRVRQVIQGILTREHLRSQDTLISEYISMQNMLTREARKH